MMSRSRLDYTPVGGRLGARLVALLCGALVLLGAGVAGGWLLFGRDASSSAAKGSGLPVVPHGPFRIDGGIGTGYSHDAKGAAAAATNWEHTLAAASNGLLDPARILPALAAAAPSTAVIAAVDALNPALSDNQMVLMTPVTVTVTEYRPARVVVPVWACTVIRSREVDTRHGLNTGGLCGTTDLAMSWEHEDWKVADRAWKQGPNLNDIPPANSPMPVPGMLTVFVG